MQTNEAKKRLRIVLLNAPRWKIPSAGGYFGPDDNGPPGWAKDNFSMDGDSLDGDSLSISYGLLSLAAQAKRSGFQTHVFNISGYDWPTIEFLISMLDADVFGFTLYQSNFRGVDALSRAIKAKHPQARVVIGGPQATALPAESLRYCPAVDLVVVGEGEVTFNDILDRLENGLTLDGIPGTAFRSGDGAAYGPPRPVIADLDTLAPIHDYFKTRLFMTSRGCPMQCTFCGAGTVWGSKVRFHSADFVLDALTKNLSAGNFPYITFKDDTFTFNRSRILEICSGIRARGLKFVWSCDSRVDCLDEDTLRDMRLAGCQRISLGVESASPTILAAMKKKILPETALEVTRLARKYGIHVRHYLIVGAPGETFSTLEETVRFLLEAQPNDAWFSSYEIFPGTPDYETARQKFGVTGDMFFQKEFERLYWPHTEKQKQEIEDWGVFRHDLKTYHMVNTLEAVRAAAVLTPDLGAAHADLAAALAREGLAAEAGESLRTARRLGYPVGGLLDNIEGVLAARDGDLARAMAIFEKAFADYPLAAVAHNMDRVRHRLHHPSSPQALALKVDTEFEREIQHSRQPELPGPFELDPSDWTPRGAA